MAIVVKLISDYAPWVYAACGIIALWYFRVALQARQERRQAAFSLEREAALNKTYNALNVAFFLLLVMGAVYFISNNVAAAVQPLVENVVSPTPTALSLPRPHPRRRPFRPRNRRPSQRRLRLSPPPRRRLSRRAA